MLNERTHNDLLAKQSLPLEVKILLTKQRIRQWHNEFGGMNYVSFSGGKDSTVLLHLVREMYPGTKAVYIDTGLEWPEVKDFALSQNNVEKIRPSMNFKEVIMTHGYPMVSKEQSEYIYEYRNTKSEKLKDIRWNGNKYGRGKISEKWKFLIHSPFPISNKCCEIMKKRPSKLFEKETGLVPFIGTLAEESSLRTTNWIRHGCNAFNSKRPTSQPLSFWTEQDILQYIKENNLEYAKCYGDITFDDYGKLTTTGVDRTGCQFCLYGIDKDKCPNRLQIIGDRYPKRYEFIMKPISDGGLGYKDLLDWVNRNSSGKVYIPYGDYEKEIKQMTIFDYLRKDQY